MKNSCFKICLFAFVLLITGTNVFALGLGVAVMNNRSVASTPRSSTAVLIPINLNETVKIEPFFGFMSFKATETDGAVFDASTTEVGVGIFMRAVPRSGVSNYFGVRIGKFSEEVNFESLSSSDSLDEYDITIITPLAGFEYGALESMFVGFEIGLSLLQGSFTDGNNSNNSADIDAQSIHSAILVRYFVK